MKRQLTSEEMTIPIGEIASKKLDYLCRPVSGDNNAIRDLDPRRGRYSWCGCSLSCVAIAGSSPWRNREAVEHLLGRWSFLSPITLALRGQRQGSRLGPRVS